MAIIGGGMVGNSTYFKDDYDRADTSLGDIGGSWQPYWIYPSGNTKISSKKLLCENNSLGGSSFDIFYIRGITIGFTPAIKITFKFTVNNAIYIGYNSCYFRIGIGRNADEAETDNYSIFLGPGTTQELKFLGGSAAFSWVVASYNIEALLQNGTSWIRIWKTTESRPIMPTLSVAGVSNFNQAMTWITQVCALINSSTHKSSFSTEDFLIKNSN